ncbi:hypothetical protein FQZ97_1035170 [compost metagenome]
MCWLVMFIGLSRKFFQMIKARPSIWLVIWFLQAVAPDLLRREGNAETMLCAITSPMDRFHKCRASAGTSVAARLLISRTQSFSTLLIRLVSALMILSRYSKSSQAVAMRMMRGRY